MWWTNHRRVIRGLGCTKGWGDFDMKNLSELVQYRVKHPTLGWGDKDGGCFVVRSPLQTNQELFVIASHGDGWDHVSVSMRKRIPTWIEMDYIRSLFFEDNEVVMQLHPARAHHINIMEYCLHLWKPQNQEIPLPPEDMV
jgi:hypothetical protein